MNREEIRNKEREIPYEYQEKARFKLYGVCPPFANPFMRSSRVSGGFLGLGVRNIVGGTPEEERDYLERQEKILILAERLFKKGGEMNREIKFRGRRVNNGEWVYGDLVINRYKDSGHIDIEGFDENGEFHCWIVDPKTVGQYTGLKDKNGKEIYEGDILRYNYHLESPDTDFIQEVIFDIRTLKSGDGESRHIGFIFRRIDRGEFWYTDIHELKDTEVIGNICENPELVGEK